MWNLDAILARFGYIRAYDVNITAMKLTAALKLSTERLKKAIAVNAVKPK